MRYRQCALFVCAGGLFLATLLSAGCREDRAAIEYATIYSTPFDPEAIVRCVDTRAVLGENSTWLAHMRDMQRAIPGLARIVAPPSTCGGLLEELQPLGSCLESRPSVMGEAKVASMVSDTHFYRAPIPAIEIMSCIGARGRWVD